MANEENGNNTIIYRLDSMERSLSLVLEKIEELNKSIADSRVLDNQTKNDIDALDKRVSSLEKNQAEVKALCYELKAAPEKANAKKWDFIADYAFKAIVAVVVGWILVKVGLK